MTETSKKVAKKVQKKTKLGKSKKVKRAPKRSEIEIAKGFLSESMVQVQARIANLDKQIQQTEATLAQLRLLKEREKGALMEVSNVLSRFNSEA